MSLDSLLAFVGILIAIYAIVDPVQRQAIKLFVSVWVIAVALGLALLLVVAPEIMDASGYSLSPLRRLGLRVCAFVLPVGGVLWAAYQWKRRKLTQRNAKGVPELIAVSLRESRFDEVKQVLQTNRDELSELPADVLDVFFDQRIVRALVSSRSFLHLELLASKDLFGKMADPPRAVDAVVREMLYADTSPLRSAVVAAYGGEEHPRYPADQQQLVETTLQDPEWFALTSAYYPLHIAAMEELWSGRLDEAYNQVGRAYEAQQGLAVRSHCPIYLYLKTHVLAIKSAIEQGADENVEVDVPGPQQSFYAIRQRSRYDPAVWESELANSDYATPYAYLLYEIVYDYQDLARSAFQLAVSEQDTDTATPPDARTKKIAQCWAICVWDIAGQDDNVSQRFQQGFVQSYLNFVLRARYAPWDISYNPGDLHGLQGLDPWWNLFVQALKRLSWDLCDKVSILTHAVDSLDSGKSYVLDGQDQLRQDLGLGDV